VQETDVLPDGILYLGFDVQRMGDVRREVSQLYVPHVAVEAPVGHVQLLHTILSRCGIKEARLLQIVPVYYFDRVGILLIENVAFIVWQHRQRGKQPEERRVDPQRPAQPGGTQVRSGQ